MFTVPVRKTTTILITAALVMVPVSAIAIYARQELGITRVAGVAYLQILRIDREVNNLPSWYSSSLLLLCSLSIAAIGARMHQRRLRLRWWTLATLVMLMSIDESVRIHERLGAFVRNLTGLGVPWIVPAGLLVVVVLIVTREVWREVARNDRLRFAQGAAVFVAGAVGMEVLHKVLSPAPDSLVHFGLVHVEEGLELCGIVLLVRAAWLVMAPNGRLMIRLGPDDAAPATRVAEPPDARAYDPERPPP